MNLLNKKLLEYIILFPILWAFTGMFLYSDGKKMMVAIVLISAIVSFFLYGKINLINNLKNIKLIWLLSAYLLFAIFAKVHYGYSSSLLRGIGCLFVFFIALPPSLLAKIDLKTLTIIGAVSTLIYMTVQVFILNNGRAWSINPIPYATFSASISALTFYYLLQCKSIKSSLIWLLSFLVAIMPLLYSQSRGLWFALAVITVIIVIRSFLVNKKSIIFLLPLILVSSFAVFLSYEKIADRIEKTQVEIAKIQEGNLTSSIGLRWQMWKAGTILISESPIIGLGKNNIDYKKKLSEQGVISEAAVHFTHYHNQFLNELVKYGFIGLTLLLVAIIYPLYCLNKNNNSHTWPGFIIISTFILASLTDVPFQHAQTITFYFIFIYLTLGLKSNRAIPLSSQVKNLQDDNK